MRKLMILPDDEVIPETRTINFTINDGTDPVSGATVSIGNKTGTTGTAGGCSLTEISDGEHTVTVIKEGYVEKVETIVVSENNTSFTISLTVNSNGDEQEGQGG